VRDFATALALAFVIEGVLYALLPEDMRRMAVRMAEQPVAVVRVAGLVAAGLGVAVIWFIRQ
jgi:uncharacterized protein